MDKHPSRRQFRFFRALRARAAFIIVGCLGLTLPAVAQYKLNGYLSAQYQNGEGNSDSPDGAYGQVRAGLMFSGTAATIFNYGLEVRFKSENQLEIEEAWAGVGNASSFRLRLGLYLVPFGKYNTANRPHQNPFIQTPLLQEHLYPESWRDIGLLTEGKWGGLGYSFYLGNGLGEGQDLQEGQQFEDNNGEPCAGGRAFFTLGQDFEVGGSYYRGKYDDLGERDLELWGIDASWESQSFLITYEYGKADIHNPAEYSRGLTEGHFVLASLTLSQLTPFVSYQALKYIDPYHGVDYLNPMLAAGIAKDVNRWAVGLVFSPAPSFLLKAEYDFNGETVIEIDNDIFLAQVAVLF